MVKAPIWEEVYRLLLDPWETRDSHRQKGFVTGQELQNAWSGRLETFSKELGLGLAEDECVYVEKKFLKTLSILVAIEYESWPSFKRDFLDHRDKKGTPDRTDECLPFPRQVLEDLGSGIRLSKADHFATVQYRFIPIILKQGLDPQVLTTSRPLPFVDQDPPLLGSGAGGVVYKEVIAPRCLTTDEGLENSVCSLIEMFGNGVNTFNPGGKDCCQKGNGASICKG